MEITHLKAEKERSNFNQQGQASNYLRTEKFIPPTHPAYVVTSSFTLPHILALQQEFDKQYIAMSMQTSKKKLARIPDTPSDKFFIVADDSAGPPLLQGQFLALPKKVVNYPISNSLETVIKEFSSYIGLGHLEVRQEKGQNRYNNNEGRQVQNLQIGRATIEFNRRQGVGNDVRSINALNSSRLQALGTSASQLQIREGHMDEGLVSKQTRAVSAISRSKVTFRQVTSRKQQMKISEGRLFIYDNRKDTSEFKALVSQIRTRYSESREIVFISRIDEFNYYCLKNKEKDHILLMSQYSYINLSEYFSNYRSIAVFDDGTSKMNYYLTNKVALFSSDKSSIFRFVQMFDRKKGQAKREKMKKLTEQLKAFSQKDINAPKIGRQNTRPVEDKSPQQQHYQARIAQRQPAQALQINPTKQNANINEKPRVPPLIAPVGNKQTNSEPPNAVIFDTDGNNNKGLPLSPHPSQIEMHKKYPATQRQKATGGQKSSDKFNQRSKVALVKVTDIDRNMLNNIQKRGNQVKPESLSINANASQIPKGLMSPMKTPAVNEKMIYSPKAAPSEIQLNASKTINSPSVKRSENNSLSIPSKSKIKRLKSSKKLLKNPSHIEIPIVQGDKNMGKLQEEEGYFRPSVKQHLRTGSEQQQKHLKIPEAKAARRSSFETKQGLKINIPSIAGSESQSDIDSYFIVPKKEPSANQRHRASISRKVVEQAQQMRAQTTLTKIVEDIGQVSSSSLGKGSSKSREDLKSYELAAHDTSFNPSLHSYRPLEHTKKEEGSDEDQQMVQMIKSPQIEDKSLNKQSMNQKVKDAEERFEEEMLVVAKPRVRFEGKKVIKAANVPPEIQAINSCQQMEDCKQVVPAFRNINPGYPNIQAQYKPPNEPSLLKSEFQAPQKSNIFGESQPSSITNSNPLILVTSPAKRQKQDHKYSFGINSQKQNKTLGKDPQKNNQLFTSPDEKNDEIQSLGLAKGQKLSGFKKEEILKQKRDQFPLKSRKITDQQKNQHLLNKIFKMPKEKEQNNPPKLQADKVIEDDPYGLPLPKSYKKKSPTGPQFKTEKETNNKRNKDKIGKIYSKLRVSPDQFKLQGADLKEIADKNKQFAQKLAKLNRVRSGYLPRSQLATQTHRENSYSPSALKTPMSCLTSQKARFIGNPPKLSSQQSSQSGNPLSPRRGRTISDLIDLSKYDKVVQNGVTIYRAKQPIITTILSPRKIAVMRPFYSGPRGSGHSLEKKRMQICNSQSSNFDPAFDKNKSSINGYLGFQTKQIHDQDKGKRSAWGSSPQPSVEQYPGSLYEAMNQSIKGITEKICQNILNRQRQSQQKTSKPETSDQGSRPYEPTETPRANKNKNLLHSKPAESLSSSQKPKKGNTISRSQLGRSPPQMVSRKSQREITRQKRQTRSVKSQLPKISQKNIEQFYSSCSQSSEDSPRSNLENMVLYLIDKNKEIDFPEVELLKKDKDTLVYFKNEKQLSQQLLKSQNIYDLVFIMTPSITPSLKRIVRQYPNAYLVDFTGGTTQISKGYVSVPDVYELEEVTLSLISKMQPQSEHQPSKISQINPFRFKPQKSKATKTISRSRQSDYPSSKCFNSQKAKTCHKCQHSSVDYCEICGGTL